MNKITQLFVVFCLAFLVIGCEKQVQTRAKQELVAEFKQLNNLLLPVSEQNTVLIWPFNDAYLIQRDQLLKQFMQAMPSDAEVALLTIEQRFTERFFPWPHNANPITNYLNTALTIDEQAIVTFINFTQKKMSRAYQDKVRLSHFELGALRNQVAQTKAKLNDYQQAYLALGQFDDYLNTYLPRRGNGIGSLPNGKDWYQARLNYFVGSAVKPTDILNSVLAIKPAVKSEEQFINCFTTTQCANTLGLDWRTSYSNRLQEFAKISFGLEQATIAEVDYGVHAQSWSSEHALTVLIKQLEIDESQAEIILSNILKEPALAMVNLPLVN